MLREPGRHAVRRALGQQVQHPMILQIDQDGPVALPPPPRPLVHADDVWGGGVGHRGRLHQPQQGIGAGPPLTAGREPSACLATEGDAEGEQALGEPQGPSRPGRRHGGQAFRKNLARARRDGHRKTSAPAAASARRRRPRADRRGCVYTGCGRAWSARGRAGRGHWAWVEVTWSVICAAASSTCHASRARVVLSGKKRAKRARTGVETKAGSSSCRVSTGNTDTVPRRSALRSVTQDRGNDVGDILYNSSGQPDIPLRHPRNLTQYASTGRITKSAEEPGGHGRVCRGALA